VAIAVIAASVADPIVEFCSNVGLFGAGRYTDHSNLDVFPTLIAGVGLLALYLVRRAPAILSGRVLSGGIASSLPLIFALQIAALYLMETTEQIVAWGHPLGSTIWLGAPLPVSFAIHALAGFAIAYAVVRSKRALAATTLRIIRVIRAIATFAPAAPQPRAERRPRRRAFKELVPALCAIGERSPPHPTRQFHASQMGDFLCYQNGGSVPP
jgi:hypothetical protein